MNQQPMIIVAPDRVLHICKLGSRLDYRVIGAYVVYVGLQEDITVYWGDRSSVRSRVVAIPPYRKHRIAAGPQFVKTILIEPETVTNRCLSDLSMSVKGQATVDPSMTGLFNPAPFMEEISGGTASSISRESFDNSVFGFALETRTLDERIEFATKLIGENIGEMVLTSDCAGEFSISSSRFRRLFVGDTGIPFRRYRMWRRARAYLEQIHAQSSLTETAFDLGYPDSTHFSRSIRSTYGLPPRQMKTRMQNSSFIFIRQPAASAPSPTGGH